MSVQTFNQSYVYAIPPAIGAGQGIALYKSPKFNISLVDKYGLSVTTASQYSNQNSLYYNVDVAQPNGTIVESNYETGLKNPSYSFTYEKNLDVFGVPTRNYMLVFKLHETSPVTVSSGQYSVYHNAAEVSGISGVLDGTLQVGNYRNRTGSIDINLSMLSNQYYRMSKFEIYTGLSAGFTVVTGTGAGGNMLKSISTLDQKANYTLSIKEGEQPSDGRYYYYKILPYDDFSSGVLYSTPSISGLMYSVDTPAFTVNNITGKNFVMLNDGNYVITTYHSGSLSGTAYNVVDRVLNVSGNIVSGGWYDTAVGDDFTQSTTQYFKTLKYLAQTIDGTGNVSSREILITDNSTSRGTGVSRTGIIYSEYAVSDNSQSAQFLVSGSGYVSGSGSILLMARVNYPTGQYKLLRTIM